MPSRAASPSDWSRLSLQVVTGVDHLHARFAARSYEMHAHEDAMVLGLVEYGEQRSSYGRGTYRAGAGSVVVIGPGIVHDGSPGRSGFVYRSLHVDRMLARTLCADVTGTKIEDVELKHPVLEHPVAFAHLRRFCIDATNPALGPADREAALLSAISAILRTAGFSIAAAGPRRTGEPRLVAMARDYIHAYLHEQGLCVSRIAIHCGASRTHLTRAFRKATGLPPHAYLNLQRVQQARRRIVAGDRSPRSPRRPGSPTRVT